MGIPCIGTGSWSYSIHCYLQRRRFTQIHTYKSHARDCAQTGQQTHTHDHSLFATLTGRKKKEALQLPQSAGWRGCSKSSRPRKSPPSLGGLRGWSVGALLFRTIGTLVGPLATYYPFWSKGRTIQIGLRVRESAHIKQSMVVVRVLRVG